MHKTLLALFVLWTLLKFVSVEQITNDIIPYLFFFQWNSPLFCKYTWIQFLYLCHIVYYNSSISLYTRFTWTVNSCKHPLITLNVLFYSILFFNVSFWLCAAVTSEFPPCGINASYSIFSLFFLNSSLSHVWRRRFHRLPRPPQLHTLHPLALLLSPSTRWDNLGQQEVGARITCRTWPRVARVVGVRRRAGALTVMLFNTIICPQGQRSVGIRVKGRVQVRSSVCVCVCVICQWIHISVLLCERSVSFACGNTNASSVRSSAFMYISAPLSVLCECKRQFIKQPGRRWRFLWVSVAKCWICRL